jgi:hypothetical protein
MAASLAQIVRALELTTIGAFVECFGLERIMRPADAPAVRRYFSFRDSHCGTCSLNISMFLTTGLGEAPCPFKGPGK